MVQEFGGRARFVVENYGGFRRWRKRFGVTRYPAIFVDDVLVATPKDFGFYGKGEGEGDGRYAPLEERGEPRALPRRPHPDDPAAARGAQGRGARGGRGAADAPELAAIPAFTLTDLEGQAVARDDLSGRVVARRVLGDLVPALPGHPGLARRAEGALRRSPGRARGGHRVGGGRRRQGGPRPGTGRPLRHGNPEVARAFGDVSAVPTLFLFDGQGRTVGGLLRSASRPAAKTRKAGSGHSSNRLRPSAAQRARMA